MSYCKWNAARQEGPAHGEHRCVNNWQVHREMCRGQPELVVPDLKAGAKSGHPSIIYHQGHLDEGLKMSKKCKSIKGIFWACSS